MRWAELLDENMPQELHRSIEEQKAACAEIVASKVNIEHTCPGVAALLYSSKPYCATERAKGLPQLQQSFHTNLVNTILAHVSVLHSE